MFQSQKIKSKLVVAVLVIAGGVSLFKLPLDLEMSRKTASIEYEFIKTGFIIER